jgi:hypothetical protein
MTDVDWAVWEERSEEIFLEPGDRVPVQTDFGFCAYDDAPAALGGGFLWFHWFPSKSEMLAALRDHAAFLYKPRGDLDIATIDAVAKGLIAATDGDLEALRCGLNERLVGLAQFTWMGSFEELCGSDHAEAKKVRGEFREDEDESPITPDEVDDFAEFTASYGV